MALLHPEDHRMAVNVMHNDPALSDDARRAVLLAYGFVRACGDSDDAMVHTIGRTAWAVGDTGETGERCEAGHARVPLLRICTGNAEACWLFSLSAFVADPLRYLKRVEDYYRRRGYQPMP